jgi:N-acetylglucosamine kinase-like BadF-type ATPase
MLLIADSGSTKTDWRLVAPDGTVTACQTEGTNPYYQTVDQVRMMLSAQLAPHLPVDAVRRVFFYGAGCSGPSVNYVMVEAIQAVLPRAESIVIDSDMLGAARAAAGHSSGIVCILGTGANACCYDGTQITRGIQSLGFWLGDEGSGGYLGKTLVRAVFQKTLPSDLLDRFQQRYNLDRPTLLDNAYKKPNPNRYFAAFTPFLSDHIDHPAVRTLVTASFQLFLQTYIVPFPESSVWPVHFVGSIAHHFAVLLRTAVEQAGITMGCTLKAPIDKLVQYHQTTN